MLKAMGGNCERRFMCRQKSADFGRRSHLFTEAADLIVHLVAEAADLVAHVSA
jgi:hypothetical protein